MPNVFFWAHKKTRSFLATKRTESLEITARTLELDVLAYDVLNRDLGSHLLFSVHRFIIAFFTPVNVYAKVEADVPQSTTAPTA